MAKTVDGYLVLEKYELDGKKSEPKNIGVAFSDWDAKEIIHRESEYYEGQPFDYSRGMTENTILYTSKQKGEKIMYVIEKCLVITGV